MKDHFIFGAHRASMLCQKCRNFTDRPHVIGVEKFCAVHCPECHPEPPAERTATVDGFTGKQEALFGG